jgi:dolichol-phosphate mannosyltransferase
MAEAVLAQGEDIHILFVDDNSPDGTGEVIDALSAESPRVHCLHRTKKEGLGRAYVAGFKKALELGAENIIQMDCDFSHDPKDVPRLLAADGDLVIGSRYVRGGSTPGWPLKRRLISRAGGIFIRAVTGMPIADPTGGFKRWRREALEKLDLDSVESSGYSFQLEMNHRAWKRGLRIAETPIAFVDRERGYSKITPGIAVESVRIALRLRSAGK